MHQCAVLGFSFKETLQRVFVCSVFLSACENPERVRCKYILMSADKHNVTSVKAVEGREDRIIVENPDLCWFGMNRSPALLTVHL